MLEDNYFIDTHTHLDTAEFDSDREEIIQRALAAGVKKFVSIGAGDGFSSSEKTLKIAEQYDFIWASVGIHPQDGKEPFDPDRLEKLMRHKKVVAVGETGLDFYWTREYDKEQYKWFEYQIGLAIKYNKPIIIHARNSADECLEVLAANNARQVGGVFHCYSEDFSFYEKIRELNFLVSVPGILTFKKSTKLRDTIKEIPLDSIMLETDAPFLAPEPYRGKRCESSFMIETAKVLADVKGISLSELAKVTTANASRLFKI